RSAAGLGFARSHEGAHELAVHLRRDGVDIEARSFYELARVVRPIDSGWFQVDCLEAGLGKLRAVFVLLERARHASDPELDTASDRGRHFPAPDDVRYREAPARAEHPERFGDHPILVGRQIDQAITVNAAP